MRLKKGLLNSLVGISVMLLNGIFSMIKISLVVSFLGNEINGFNNVIGQIFNFLMISEAGLGLATTTLLYKSISKNDIESSNKFIAGSQRTIQIIVCFIIFASAICSLFIPIFIKNNSLSNLFISISFLLYALKVLIPQLTQPIKSYAMANQDEYIVNFLKGISIIGINIIEIIMLLNGNSYIIVLFGGVLGSIIFELLNLYILKRKYPFIKLLAKEKDYSATRHMKNLVKVNIVSTVAKSIDPVVISKFIGLAAASFYSNYSYIQNFLQTIIGTVMGPLNHIFGDMFARKEENIYLKFNMYIILCNFIASIVSIMFYLLIQIFIPIWIGNDALLPNYVVILFACLIYMYSSMRPMNTLVITNGFFEIASKSAIYETVINLVLSILTVNYFGLSGVLISSIISFLIASFWYFPLKTYKKVFKKSPVEYFVRQFYSVIVLIPIFFIASLIIEKYFIAYEFTFIDFIFLATFSGISISSLMLCIYYSIFGEFRNLLKFILDKATVIIKK